MTPSKRQLQEIFPLFSPEKKPGQFGANETAVGLRKKNQKNPNIYFIGIKGTGMCALAQLLQHLGCQISGSDVAQHFYTDQLLRNSKIFYHQGFAASQVPLDCDLVIYSAAYDDSNSEFAAAQQRQYPMLSYPEALAYISQLYSSCLAIVGVHGKTTSTLLASTLIQSLKLPGSAVAGAGAPHLHGNAYLVQGQELLVVEACEYRNHFFRFEPQIVLLTSLEWDHQDFFTSYAMMQQSFRNFLAKTSVQTIIYCADDPGAHDLIASISSESQAQFIPYGLSAGGDFAVALIESREGETLLHLKNQPEFPLRLKVPGDHLAMNALGALAALYHSQIICEHYSSFSEFLQQDYPRINAGLAEFRGASRRAELLGKIPWQGGQVLILDDYAHHPTAVRKTLAGFKRFYPQHRLVLDFMSHTYSRTESLHREFSACFQDADILILHDIYSSAREGPSSDYNGQTLWWAVNQQRSQKGLPDAYYFPEPLDALLQLRKILQPGDLFVIMGAGSNRELALALREGVCAQ